MESRSRFRASFNRGKSSDSHQPAQSHATAEATTQPVTVHPPVHHEATETHKRSPKPKKLGFFHGRKWLLIAISVVAIAFVGLGYMYMHTKSELNKAKNPEVAGKNETQKIVSSISSSVDLPSGETPTLATVSDVAKLKTQAFFKNAQNGDKVLVYTKAGKAVLYRPSTKKVIVYSFINTGSNQ